MNNWIVVTTNWIEYIDSEEKEITIEFLECIMNLVHWEIIEIKRTN